MGSVSLGRSQNCRFLIRRMRDRERSCTGCDGCLDSSDDVIIIIIITIVINIFISIVTIIITIVIITIIIIIIIANATITI